MRQLLAHPLGDLGAKKGKVHLAVMPGTQDPPPRRVLRLAGTVLARQTQAARTHGMRDRRHQRLTFVTTA
jgi:hypothetical protein